ncbi:MAG: tRNA pseudouridine(55) synthase TruB [Oscillospiraceae bacterium]|nr:tRNA pseudouridine(55) synthase TruB [Oscillospiraceae bacterium]
MTSLNGIIVVNKPREFTSFDVVAVVRGCLHTKKVGHSGTLDPMATGVLPVFVGGATKAISLLPDHDKSYRAGFRLGLTSDTLDIWGDCSEQKNVDISTEILRKALEKFRGDIEQIPPMYSALKVNGQKLCDLARKGIEVERKPRKVTITRLELVSFDGRDGVLDVDCSSGTYIRSLVDDIGLELGTGAVMTALERTRACGFSLGESVSVDELRALSDEERLKLLKPVESVFSDYSVIQLDEAQTRLYLNGVRLDTKRLHGDFGEGIYRVYGDGFIGLAKIQNNELISMKRFNGE